jgi:hypothetical protein
MSVSITESRTNPAMNGYLKAMQRIASANLPTDAETRDGSQIHLVQWIRSMSYVRDTDRRIEKPSATGDNVVTLRMGRDRTESGECTAFDPDAASRNTVDAAVSFLLNVLFDANRSKAEIRIARAMFRPTASIVLIPRDRPSLACAVGVDEFFAAEKTMLKYEDSWEESWRIHDPCADSAARIRICAHILLDPKLDSGKPRSTEVVFALRNASNAQRIHSCTIVYDEAPRASSPVTLFA